FAPPIRRGEFLNISVLHADAGNGNHQPSRNYLRNRRAITPRVLFKRYLSYQIWERLSWTLLVHYNLPATKDKNAAKVRLLNALNSFKLEVPSWIMNLESDLKKDWDAENCKLKK
ncbi:hypothetical protein B0J11DRAFT_399509, partial [Dendryphion nanum]